MLINLYGAVKMSLAETRNKVKESLEKKMKELEQKIEAEKDAHMKELLHAQYLLANELWLSVQE